MIIPLTGQLVLSKVLTDSVLSLLAIPRVKEQRQITEHLLLSLNKATQESHGNFIVLLQDLSGESLSHYRDFLRNAQINYIDGSSIAADNQSKLPDGHPGPDMTQLWANQLAEYITTNYAAIPISRLAN